MNEKKNKNLLTYHSFNMAYIFEVLLNTKPLKRQLNLISYKSTEKFFEKEFQNFFFKYIRNSFFFCLSAIQNFHNN